MADHQYDWNNDNPLDLVSFKDAVAAFRNTLEAFDERFGLEHNIGLSTDEDSSDFDGRHKKVTMASVGDSDEYTTTQAVSAGVVDIKRDQDVTVDDGSESKLTKLFYTNDKEYADDEIPYEHSVCDLHRNIVGKTLSQCKAILEGATARNINAPNTSPSYTNYLGSMVIHNNVSGEFRTPVYFSENIISPITASDDEGSPVINQFLTKSLSARFHLGRDGDHWHYSIVGSYYPAYASGKYHIYFSHIPYPKLSWEYNYLYQVNTTFYINNPYEITIGFYINDVFVFRFNRIMNRIVNLSEGDEVSFKWMLGDDSGYYPICRHNSRAFCSIKRVS